MATVVEQSPTISEQWAVSAQQLLPFLCLSLRVHGSDCAFSSAGRVADGTLLRVQDWLGGRRAAGETQPGPGPEAGAGRHCRHLPLCCAPARITSGSGLPCSTNMKWP